MQTTPLSDSSIKHTYFRPTTASQRELLFNTVEQIDNISAAALQAHVGRGTYYYWLPRFESEGIAGLAHTRSRAPRHTRIPPTSPELCQEVLAYHQAHPQEGYRSVANAIRKAHNWEKVIGPNKVGEIIRAANPVPLPPASPSVAQSPATLPAVHAPQPDQTANIDLCVVPCTHTDTQDWVSVSMSKAAEKARSTPSTTPPPTATWPGQVFANSTLSYAEQMQSYGEQRTAKRLSKGQRKHHRRQKQAARAELNAQRDELRLQRRRQRLARRQADHAWSIPRQAHRAAEQAWRRLSPAERMARRAERRAQQNQWQADQAARCTQIQQRHSEDEAWRQARRELQSRLDQLVNATPLGLGWIAILVVVCNGTRRCLGLPLFTAGVHVTSEMIVAALRMICPAELQFIISDNGAQFIADTFTQFVKEQELIHVRIAPRRACTNGIAERFVRTLKEWLETHTWNTPEELSRLLTEFIEYYNDRPHQGAELDGLSPNEFAQRLRSCSTC